MLGLKLGPRIVIPINPVKFEMRMRSRGVIHQLLNIILQLRILVSLLLSTLPYVVKVKNYS
jgi:hypothetical protein